MFSAFGKGKREEKVRFDIGGKHLPDILAAIRMVETVLGPTFGSNIDFRSAAILKEGRRSSDHGVSLNAKIKLDGEEKDCHFLVAFTLVKEMFPRPEGEVTITLAEEICVGEKIPIVFNYAKGVYTIPDSTQEILERLHNKYQGRIAPLL
jgi:hypothetical protein